MDLLSCANTAMHHAKSQGKACYAVFDSQMDNAARERFELEVALRRAVVSGEIHPHYQPIQVLRTGEVVALEALARWQRPDGSFTPPSSFIPVAEETGLILPLGAALLHAACTQGARWRRDLPHPRLHINVNVSERQLHQHDFVSLVQAALRESGLPATALTLELTESILLENTELCFEKLEELKAGGVQLALDDFGTGYSSLAYLSRLPVHAIKIDRSFVSALTHSDPKALAQNDAIIRTILALAQILQLEVTAEGIEELAQKQRLIALGARFAQGYLFCTPLPAQAIPHVLAQMHLPRSQRAA